MSNNIDVKILSLDLSKNEDIEKYMRLLADGSGTQKQRMGMLNKKRNGILSEVHFKEKQISRLDYLRYEIQKENQKKGD